MNGIIDPKIACQRKCKDCGHVFRPDYYEQYNYDLKCPKCGSENVRYVWIDFLLDIVKY